MFLLGGGGGFCSEYFFFQQRPFHMKKEGAIDVNSSEISSILTDCMIF